ncbi:MAG TPA: acyltransferase [Acidimicrobiales bacterium]|nr:acyltransferase [Acidimicrobiales bacterium]
MVDVAPVPAPEAVDDVRAETTDHPRARRWWSRHGRPTHQPAAARPRHFPCFDGLRAIAAVLIVVVHTSFASGFTVRSWVGIYTARLEIGVSVFFLISGFLLYRPFAASHFAGGAAPSIGKFWVRRFLRIMPAYWLAFLVTNYGMHIDRKVHPGWHSLLIYLGLLQVYFPSHALTGITQAWSLCTEIAFYLFLPLYAMIVTRRRRSDHQQLIRELVALSGLFATGLGLRFWLLHLHSPLAYVMLEWLPACFDLFALGMLLAVSSSWLAHRRATPRWLWHPVMPWVSWLVALGLLWVVSHLGVSRSPLEHNTPGRGMAMELLYGLFAFFLLVPAVFGPQQRGVIRGVLRWKPVAALGVVSYGVYLWHQAWVDEYLRWTGALFRVPLPELFGVVVGLAVATAAASYVFVERPILGLKDRLGWWSSRPHMASSCTAARSTRATSKAVR